MKNLITDIEGVTVGAAEDERVATGVSVVMFEEQAVASIAIHGGSPGVRDTALLEPEMKVPGVDALVLSGGSAFGLDAMGGVMAYLRQFGRGFPVGDFRVPIVPGAILGDLLNGGDKNWGRPPPYWQLGYEAASGAAKDFALGTAGAGYGATTADLKGGLGSASAVSSRGFLIGALVAVNAMGRVTRGATPHFWATPYERGAEFGGLGEPAQRPADALDLKLKGDQPPNTTIAVVATDARLTKADMKRVAIMAQDGIALALRPAHAPTDGDVVFAATTSRAALEPDVRDLTEIGMLAAECLARAIARGVYEATSLKNAIAPRCWREVYGR
ncbi:MAG TPA: P1 family peptidase [Roseiarcus sp.]|nr:P1 family peptidase [Roseiarcus sp.]